MPKLKKLSKADQENIKGVDKMRSIILKNKTSGSEFNFEDATSIIENDTEYHINFHNRKPLCFNKADWDIVTYDDEPVYKFNKTIMQLEKENEKLKRVIINMCKYAFGGANNEN